MFKILNSEYSSQSDFDIFYNKIEKVIIGYPYYHYQNYPSKNTTGWVNIFLHVLKKCLSNKNHYLFYEDSTITPVFIVYHINKWDFEHFGIRMANSILVFSFPNTNINILDGFINKGIKHLDKLGVQFVSTRINGDNLSLINAHLKNYFKYYETIIRPVLKTKHIVKKIEPCKVLTDKKKLNIVKNIAEKYQYQRGHYHCDSNFNKDKVNSMYAKWVETSFYSDDNICIIEKKGTIVGYFICSIDSTLEKYLGYKYGRLKALVLNSEYRGEGLGIKLFASTLSYLQKNGCAYIESGYPAKNHLSSFLHSANHFHSNYEEVSLHYWITDI
jgi:hypothetical protein